MADIRFVDTTIRDGHLSLWASGMTTGMMLPAIGALDDAGFEAIEILSDGQMGKALRELGDDPFERIRLVAERARKTPLRLIAGRIATFGYEPPEAFALFLDLAARNGISEVRISDPWNEAAGWKRRLDAAHAAGLRVILNLVYSISPVHTDSYYAERCREAASLGAWRLCFKDPGGLLTPDRTRALAPIMLANAGATPVEFHTHCTTGLGPLCCLEAIAGGMTIVNTALPPLSDGSSNPSTFDVAANASALGHTPALDLDSLKPVSRHFATVARREGFPIGRPLAFDAAQHRHQIPGGMISNLAFQLRKVGMEDRLEETLEETVRVRAELGYPVMVTPLSQFVGSQAAINVIAANAIARSPTRRSNTRSAITARPRSGRWTPKSAPASSTAGAPTSSGAATSPPSTTSAGASAAPARRTRRRCCAGCSARTPSRCSAAPARPSPIRAAATRWSSWSTGSPNATTGR